ncbi:MAG: hypothetical protein WED33_03670 [Bacteroidia bacterium]
MDTPNLKQRVLVGGLSLALLISVFFAGLFNIQRNNLFEELSGERLQTESLMQSKELLQVDLVDLESRLATVNESEKVLKSENIQMSKRVNDLEMSKSLLVKESNSLKSKIKQLKKAEEELAQFKSKYKSETDVYSKEKEKYQNQVEKLEKEVSQLQTKLNARKTVAADYFRIDALKSKNKQTRRGKKVRRILVSFNWNDDLIKEFKDKPLYLTLSGPGLSQNGAKNFEKVSIKVDEQLIQIPVVAKAKIQSVSKGRQEIIMETSTRLKAGIYQADVYTDVFHLGGAQIKLD